MKPKPPRSSQRSAIPRSSVVLVCRVGLEPGVVFLLTFLFACPSVELTVAAAPVVFTLSASSLFRDGGASGPAAGAAGAAAAAGLSASGAACAAAAAAAVRAAAGAAGAAAAALALLLFVLSRISSR